VQPWPVCSFWKQFEGLLLQLETQVALCADVLQQSHQLTAFGNEHIEESQTVQQPHWQVPDGQTFTPVRHWQLTEVFPLHPHPP
jgi:hypothetical protein